MAPFKRLRRLSEIGAIIAKYGLAPYLPKILASMFKIENIDQIERSIKDLSIEERFRLAFEEMGTTFIKLGQLLSLRGDIIPISMAKEFQKLQDNVGAKPFEHIKPIIESELDMSIEEVFSDFNEIPIASASISQVYSAKLKDSGEDVVIKVRKPGIVKTIEVDMEIILWVADTLHRHSKHSKQINFKGIAEEFFFTMKEELDLLIEKTNTQKFISNFAQDEWEWLKFPEMIENLCTSKVLVMEKLSGYKLYELNELDPVKKAEIKIKEISEKGSRLLMKMILQDGFFHADLHAGNLFFLEGGKVSIIDCGMCSRIDRYLKERIADMFIAFAARDYEKLATVYLEMSETGTIPNKKDFIRDIRKLVESLPENIASVNTAELIQKTSILIFKYKLKFPRELTQLFRSLTMLEGLCQELDPDFEFFTVAEKLSNELIVQRYSPERVAAELFALLVRLIDVTKTLPGNISDIVDKIENGTLQHRFLVLFRKSERNFFSKMVSRFCSAFMLAGSLISFGSMKEPPYCYIAWSVFALSLFIFLLTFRKGKDDDNA
jgi:ubiquinone biosynthesis protein